MIWTAYWSLAADPFLGPGSPYVPTPSHEEAVARLTEAVGSGQRLAVLRAAGGLGKSAVLARAAAEVRGPLVRVARVSAPVDGGLMFAGLAAGLGGPPPTAPGRPAAWKALGDAVRLCRWQRVHAVLVVDDAQGLSDPADARDLGRLPGVDPDPATRLTVWLAYRDPPDDAEPAPAPTPDWQLDIRLAPLTRSESSRYLADKLAVAGRAAPAFTPGAVGRLHDLAGGNPRGLDRLASLALMAGALRGLDRVPPEVVSGVARECALPATGFAA